MRDRGVITDSSIMRERGVITDSSIMRERGIDLGNAKKFFASEWMRANPFRFCKQNLLYNILGTIR